MYITHNFPFDHWFSYPYLVISFQAPPCSGWPHSPSLFSSEELAGVAIGAHFAYLTLYAIAWRTRHVLPKFLL